ncbi:GT2 family glycosyltransferase [Chelatococcus asaccharovorans]|uniref:GT2 family glycosyltransferase n=1 Tax=Chelatococcus asaccharovorans TaxID=28210 RepID=A0A2V3TSJ9_9HYPH|nr:GT2 family glycosyltransferase [Chelatococcus asaccharovorans]
MHVRSPLLSSRHSLLLGSSSRSDFALHALDAYQRGDHIRALALIDRCCRAFVPDAEHYRLRAAINEALGAVDAAERDLASALKLTPDDLALRAHWLRVLIDKESERDFAALAAGIFRDDRADIHAAVVARAFAAGETPHTGRHWLDGETIVLHCLWRGEKTIALTLRYGDGRKDSRADNQEHLIDVSGQAAENYKGAFDYSMRTSLPWPDGADRCAFFWPSGEAVAPPILRPVVEGKRGDARETTAAIAAEATPRPPRRAKREAPVTVLIPAYRNLPATRDCIEAVLREPGHGKRYDVIVVDDASPEPELSAYLRDLSAAGKIRLLAHARNMGFIGAVETGLAETTTSDVILLNADTVVPTGWLKRLRAAAYAADNIGTVTPLSNNGDLTSYPVPFGEAPMPEPDYLALIDATAARVNAGGIVDLPSGIGFCFYIRRTCLRALGFFGSDFLTHGYFEDVDFCLRAEEKGFRNVCATDVVVGHLGSASYLDAKRGLVLRNQAETLRRFPDLRRHTTWFMETDPLATARHRITEGLWPDVVRAHTAVVSTCVDTAAGEELLRNLQELQGLEEPLEEAWIHIAPEEHGAVTTLAVKVMGMVGRLPIALPLPASESGRLEALLRTAGVKRIIVLAGEAPSPDVLAIAERLKAEVDAVLVEAPQTAGDLDTALTAWSDLLARAGPIVPGCAALRDALAAHGREPVHAPLMTLERAPPASRPAAGRPDDPLAIVPLDDGPAAFALVRALALKLNQAGRDTPLLVVGETLDDAALMRLGNVFVLGKVDPQEWSAIVATYRSAGVVVPSRRLLLADSRISILAGLPAPIAAFSQGLFAELATGPYDLALPPDAGDEAAAAAIGTWLAHL